MEISLQNQYFTIKKDFRNRFLGSLIKDMVSDLKICQSKVRRWHNLIISLCDSILKTIIYNKMIFL